MEKKTIRTLLISFSVAAGVLGASQSAYCANICCEDDIKAVTALAYAKAGQTEKLCDAVGACVKIKGASSCKSNAKTKKLYPVANNNAETLLTSSGEESLAEMCPPGGKEE